MIFCDGFKRPAAGFADSVDRILKRVVTLAREPEREDVAGSAQSRRAVDDNWGLGLVRVKKRENVTDERFRRNYCVIGNRRVTDVARPERLPILPEEIVVPIDLRFEQATDALDTRGVHVSNPGVDSVGQCRLSRSRGGMPGKRLTCLQLPGRTCMMTSY